MSTDKVNPPAAGANPERENIAAYARLNARLLGQLDEARSVLADALYHLHEHDAEYHHQTPADLLERIERILSAALPPVAEKT